MKQDKLAELNQHLSAAKHTGRKLDVTELSAGYKATFWKPDGDGVKCWTATDPDLLTAIAKAGEKYALDMMAHHVFGEKEQL
jgi:hypothetical protein